MRCRHGPRPAAWSTATARCSISTSGRCSGASMRRSSRGSSSSGLSRSPTFRSWRRPSAVDFGFEPDKRAVRPVANFQAPDWPDNPFAAPPAKPAQPSSPPPQHAQRPQHAKPQAAAPQQNAWPQPPAGSPSPFQANWPNAAPSAPPPQPPQQPRPNSNAAPQQAKPQPQGSWPQRRSAAPDGRAAPATAAASAAPAAASAAATSKGSIVAAPQPKPQPVADADFDGAWQQQPSRPMGQPPGEAELEAAWQQPNQPKPQPRSRPQAATPPPPPPPLPVEEPETPSRKKALLKWGLVTLLIAIMAVGGWMVLGQRQGLRRARSPRSPACSIPTTRGAARPTGCKAPRSVPSLLLSSSRSTSFRP